MGFSDDEIERYARHIVMRDIGGPGQAKLKKACVLVIGAGGLGAPILSYLAAAGVGTLGIVDDDIVSLSNLQRQVIHNTSDLGRLKTESAADAINRLNPHINVQCHSLRLDSGNAEKIFENYDVIADGSDNFATRYLVADICHTLKKPLISGALGQFDASLTTLKPFEAAPNGHFFPSYRTLFPAPPAPGSTPTCEESGVIGALPGVVGSLMALEVIREIVGFGESLVGKFLIIDALTMRFETIHY